jgi:DNA-binding transcriptional MocR family regulator
MNSGLVQSGGGLNPFTSGVMHSLIGLGLADEGLDRLRVVYAERSRVMCRAIRDALPTAVFAEPEGGYFVWLGLPAEISSSALQPKAAQFGVTFHAGSRFIGRPGFTHHARLSFAHYDTPELIEGVHRLARAASMMR